MWTEELKPAGLMGGGELFQEQAPKQSGQDPYWEEEAGFARDPTLAIEGEATTRDDAVHMGMMGQGRAPGVQYHGDADVGTEMLWIGSDGEQGLGGGFEQQMVDHRLILIGDLPDGGR